MAPDSERQWPPRSPHEALLSTPGGRQRYREMMNRTSPSPSPMKSARALAAITSSPGAGLGIQLPAKDEDEDEDEDGDGDEDEETLQLKLQEIQAKLKLKKLQSARAREKVASHRDGEANIPSDAVFSSPDRRARARTPGADENVRPALQNQVTVPASPVRKLQFLQQQTSPSRVLLGIDKGLKAKDVSLKRAPSQKGHRPGTSSQVGVYLSRSRSVHPSVPSAEAARPLSFNERLAQARTEEVARAERIEKIQRVRTSAFSIGQEEMDGFRKSAVSIPDEPLPPPTFTRQEILSQHTAAASKLPRSKTAPSLHHSQPDSHNSNLSSATAGASASASATAEPSAKDESSFEPYSCLHLSRRILPHTVVTRHVTSKKVLNIKDLLRDVKSPNYALPDVEQDIVVFAVVARKSEPRAHKPTANQKQEDRGKYLVMTLTDLELELDLFLFNSGFMRFWKLTQGTVVAILNPNIMPPPPGRQDTGRFSLVINSDEDTILEIGSARDLGFCQSVKRDGELCGTWVNKKKTHYCEFHSNEAIRKQRSSRVEVNASGFGGWEKRSKFGSGQKKNGSSNYDWETRTQWFAARSLSAADLIDGKDRGAADRKEKAEAVKRNMEAKEKERDMMKKLGNVGHGAGREYMERAGLKGAAGPGAAVSKRAKGPVMTDEEEQPAKRDALSLGLTGKDRTVHLSPVKRKRPDSSQASSVTGSSNLASSSAAGFGWGSHLRDKLSKMKEGEKLHRGAEAARVRKKTRFITDKGIREAGRESLGMDISERQVSLDDDDDDDELVIV
ncbi:cell division cycle protein [Metarhizium album ARSEF 1941]|uniref:Cell division cycle protein n=1 Tax=Metarhizium album (strain ARSEF 1941) TaxID=1081103 RepID=A0A0B2WSR8_METAS|nr:cell division cycle protein [Metarhizium album ARSEF 1941]KHN99116.1 cell division cycle protein [Metarhizium album ARSEF 1941]